MVERDGNGRRKKMALEYAPTRERSRSRSPINNVELGGGTGSDSQEISSQRTAFGNSDTSDEENAF